jgi:hypothetical protein
MRGAHPSSSVEGVRALALPIAIAVAATVAACGDDTVDTAKVESGIEKQLATPTATVSNVNCPSDVESSAGTSFTCSVKWDNGATGKVKVTQHDGNTFSYAPVSGSVQVPGTEVAQSVEKSLAQQGYPDAAVTCPENVIVKVGTTVTCNASGAGGNATGSVTFTFSSADGTVDESSVKTA